MADPVRSLLAAVRALADALEARLDCPTQAPPLSPAGFCGCPREILDTLRAVGHRLTGEQLMVEMDRRGWAYSDTKIRTTAGIMVDLGILSNVQEGSSRGYGLAEWG